jgi:hypothetical protein
MPHSSVKRPEMERANYKSCSLRQDIPLLQMCKYLLAIMLKALRTLATPATSVESIILHNPYKK